MSACLHTERWAALGTGAALALSGAGNPAAARRAVERELAAIDAACSRFREDSELMALNAAGGHPRRVSPQLAEAIRVALRAAALTGGLVDPTVGESSVSSTATGKIPGGKVTVDDNTQLGLTLSYMIRDHIGVELLAATPFKHEVGLKGLGALDGKLATIEQLPPTLSLQYFPLDSSSKWQPYIGAGINYTTFFSEDTTGALDGLDLELKDSWGLAAHAGLDFAVGDKGALRVDVRWIDIDADVKLEGAGIGTANIDPLAYGVTWVFRY